MNCVVPSRATVTVMSVAPASSSTSECETEEMVSPVGAVSSSIMVPSALVTPRGTISGGVELPMVASSSITTKVSAPSAKVSWVVVTVKVADLSPAGMDTVPLAAV